VNKTLTPRHKAPMEVTTAERPFEKCYLDVVGPLPVTQEGNNYILTFQDDLSKYVVAVPITQQDAETVARTFVDSVTLTYGTHYNMPGGRGQHYNMPGGQGPVRYKVNGLRVQVIFPDAR